MSQININLMSNDTFISSLRAEVSNISRNQMSNDISNVQMFLEVHFSGNILSIKTLPEQTPLMETDLMRLQTSCPLKPTWNLQN